MTRIAIATLTMNPALDITTSADIVRHTDKIRCGAATYDAGGGWDVPPLPVQVARSAETMWLSSRRSV